MNFAESPLPVVIITELVIVLINVIFLKSIIHEKFVMERENNFYVFLPSNVHSRVHYAGNTVGNFTTTLRRRLKFPLNEKWEVGLAEISFTKSWYTLTKDNSVKLF